MKKTLFEGNKRVRDDFRKNKEFERKFNYRKKREEMQRLKEKFGDGEARSQSDSQTEDEIGEFTDDQVFADFITTYSKIKAHHPDIYQEKTKFFDLKLEQFQNRSRKPIEKKYTIKDMIVENLGKEEEVEQEEVVKETPLEEQNRLKSEFLEAALGQRDDNLLVKRNQTRAEQIEEEKEIEKYFQNKKFKKGADEIEMVKRYWAKDRKDSLDDGQKFLRDYLMKKKWIEREDRITDFREVDQEDKNLDEKVDHFESRYNFRHEEKDAKQINFYARDIKESLRKPKEKRKLQREKKKLRKEEQMKRNRAELQKFKDYKKKGILKKIMKLKEISGNKGNDENLKRILVQEFDENYDQIMEHMFGDKYYGEEEYDQEEIQKYLDNIETEFSLKKTKISQEKQNFLEKEKEEGLIPKVNIPIEMKHKLNKTDAKVIEKNTNKNLWWFCDNCSKGIEPLSHRFDCMQCNDFTLCKPCYNLKEHNFHKIKKFIVPEGCFPPGKTMIEQILNRFKICVDCNNKINTTESYYVEKKDQEHFLCSDCILYIGDEFRLRDFEQIRPIKKELSKKRELMEDLAEYQNIDFEDVIAGGIKTRYDYIDVEPEHFGLNDAELFFADDKLLNQMISIKKLAPYRKNAIGAKERNRIRKTRTLVKQSAERNQKKFKKEQELIAREEELKQLSKKSKKYLREYEELIANKERIIEQIYEEKDSLENRLKKKDFKIEEDIEGLSGGEIEGRAAIDEDRLRSYGISKNN